MKLVQKTLLIISVIGVQPIALWGADVAVQVAPEMQEQKGSSAGNERSVFSLLCAYAIQTAAVTAFTTLVSSMVQRWYFKKDFVATKIDKRVNLNSFVADDSLKKEVNSALDYYMAQHFYTRGNAPAGSSQGILLHGPTGNGKTMLAQVIAREIQKRNKSWFGTTQFIQVDAGDLNPDNIDQLFESARKSHYSVLCIENIDIISRIKDSNSEGNSEMTNKFSGNGDMAVKHKVEVTTDPHRRTLRKLLDEMSSQRHEDWILCVATTRANLGDLHQELLGPGKFTRSILLPDANQALGQKILDKLITSYQKSDHPVNSSHLLAHHVAGKSYAAIRDVVSHAMHNARDIVGCKQDALAEALVRWQNTGDDYSTASLR